MRNYAYVTLATNSFFLKAAYILQETFKKTNSPYPFIVMIPEVLKKDFWLKKIDSYRIIPIDEFKTDSIYRDTINKFYCYNYTEFEKIIFIDADMIFLENLDFLFQYNFLFFCDIYYPSRYAEKKIAMPNNNVFLITPTENFYQRLLELNSKYNIDDDEIFIKDYVFPEYFQNSNFDDVVNVFYNFNIKLS